MPVLQRLIHRGMGGPLRSIVPPITVPAWASMFSGRDPGELGIYGFRGRIAGSRRLQLNTTSELGVPRVWDVVARAGKRACALFAPPSWPPAPYLDRDAGYDPDPARLAVVGCLLTPGSESAIAWPDRFASELSRFGSYRADIVVDDDASLGDLVDALYAAAEQHFDIAEYALRAREPELLAMVEIGTDRLHHALWPALDPEDPKHEVKSPWVREARDYYSYLDSRLGRLIELAGSDVATLVVSDHGARSLRGGFRINEWLAREGFLCLLDGPVETSLENDRVDWSRSIAWGEGGYFARVTLNTKARFLDGALDDDRVEATLATLEARLSALVGPDGKPICSRVVRPSRIYRALHGEPPDLMVFVGDLDYRALAEVGHGTIWADANEVRGTRRNPFADGCNHDWNGVFALSGPGIPRRGWLSGGEGANLYDVGRTVLDLLGVEVPAGWRGADLRRLG